MLARASCFLCLGLMFGAIVDQVQAGTQTIRFDELTEYAETYSPRTRIINYEFDRIRAERDKELQWSNPELSLYRDNVDRAEEYQITLGKRFEAPWVYFKKRSGWADELAASKLRQQQGAVDHIAELKSGYVRLQLFNEYLTRLGRLKAILTDASHIATTRHTEGHLSGVEEHLIQMSVISLNASYQSAKQEQRESTARWRAALGVSTDDSLALVTSISYRSVELQSIAHYVTLIDSQPGLRALTSRKAALTKWAAAERAGFIPSLYLYVGRKKIDPDFSGYLAGASLSLPLLNRNSAASQKYEVESSIAAHEARLYQSQLTGYVKALVRSISESQLSLATEVEHFDEDTQALNNLLYTYEEGWMTLNELLNAIQIEVGGLKDYYNQLIRYYENVIALEALTGESLVSF
jgi:Outer membrane efflux protein